MGKGGEAKTAHSSVKGQDKSEITANDLTKRYTWQQVKQHATPEDAWIVYNNKVYNVSGWHQHPGGSVIFSHAGDDMTDIIFAAFQEPGSQAMMKQFLIGDLIPESVKHKDDKQRNFEKGYRDLRAKLVMMGMFKSNYWYYLYKQLEGMSMWARAMAVMYYSESVSVQLFAAVWMGLFIQQGAFLTHDFWHHQVFKNKLYDDLHGLFWGDVMLGYSLQWWKNKHNAHHSVPTLHTKSPVYHDGDLDIDSMPLLAWSLKQAQSFRELNDGKDSRIAKFMVGNQKLFYFPLLLLARINWLIQSLLVGFSIAAPSETARLEMEHNGL